MEASPILPTPSGRAQALDQFSALEYRQSYRLMPILRAIELLADSQRVIHDLEDATRALSTDDGESPFEAGLSKACESWRNPIRDNPTEGGFSVLQDLARVATEIGGEIGREMEQVSLLLRRTEEAFASNERRAA